jgi:hypothetical protein
MDFDAIAAAKAERRAALIEALTATPVDADTSARERLERLLSPETLADLDERVLARVTGEGAPEPEPAFLDAAAAAHEAQRRAVVDAVLGRGARTSAASMS